MQMPRKRSPFDILGVDPSDDMTTIRMAWRAKVKVLHPDVASDKARATGALAEVNAAFDALQGHKPQKSWATLRREAEAKKRAADILARKKAAAKRRAEEEARRVASLAAKLEAEQLRKTEDLRRMAQQRSARAAEKAPANSPFKIAATGYAKARRAIDV